MQLPRFDKFSKKIAKVYEIYYIFVFLLLPQIAQAEPGIKYENVAREFGLILVAFFFLGIVFFLQMGTSNLRMRPVGRRFSDLQKLNEIRHIKYSKVEMHMTAPERWEGCTMEKLPIVISKKTQIWSINLYATKLIEGNEEFANTATGLYSFASSAEEADEIISPIIRKIYARYRNQFEMAAPVSIEYSDWEGESYTWLSSHTAIRTLLFRFLDECLLISNFCQSDPLLTICRGTCFWISVSWPELKGAELLKRIANIYPELEIINDKHGFGLKLHISFNKERIRAKKNLSA